MAKRNEITELGRCPWAKTELYVLYHDSEWGVPVHDDRLLFEFLILEGAAGSEQKYVEDCPVCCCPNLVHVEIDEGGDVRVWAERE